MPISKRSFFFLPLFIPFSAILLSLSAPYAHAQDKSVLVARLHSLENISVIFTRNIQYSPDMELVRKRLPPEVVETIFNGDYRFDSSFKFLSGQAIYEDTMTDETRKFLEQKSIFMATFRRCIYTPARVMNLDQSERQNSGSITNKWDRKSEELQFDITLGLRVLHGTAWLTAVDLDAQTAAMEGNRQWTLTQTDEKGSVQKWIYDVDQRHALISYTYTNPLGQTTWELTNSDFVTVGNVSVPQKSVLRSTSFPQNIPHIVKTETLQATKILVGDPQNLPEQYDMVWPNHSIISDRRSHKVFQVTTGPCTLSDDELSKLRELPAPTPAAAPFPGPSP